MKLDLQEAQNANHQHLLAVDGSSKELMDIYNCGQGFYTVLGEIRMLKNWLEPQKLGF